MSTSSMSISSSSSACASMRASVASTSRSWRCTVSANDATALSMRLSTFTRSRWIRLSSRSDLPEEALAAADLGAVLLVVGRLLVRQHVAKRRVGGEVQPADLVVDVADRAELAGQVDVGLDVDRLEAVGEAAGLGGAVVLLDVLARAGDGQQVEQREVVEAEHLDQARRRALGVVEIEPAVELLLRQPRRAVDAGDAVLEQRRVVALGGEGDLVPQVGQAVVDRRGREHQHRGLDALLDDPAHQAVVAGLAALPWRPLVAEVVRLVDDDEVVVAPVDVGEVDVARQRRRRGRGRCG